MFFHDVRENVPVFRQCEGMDGFGTGERLEAEFRTEPEIKLPEFRERLQLMPNIPIMDITAVFIIRVVKAAA